MERAGVKLVEVGTTNRTRVKDYRDAITPKAAMLLRAYPSNYRIAGFTESVTMPELVALGREHSLPVVDDLGGGLLDDWTSHGLPYEPTVSESIQAGADLVLVSGDKILGGPQAGIILGRRDLVAKLKKSPLARVVRADKMTLAALNATLRHYVSPGGLQAGLPVWEMLTDTVDAMRTRAERLLAVLQPLTAWTQLEIVDSSAETGSGTLPATAIPSIAICARASKWNPSKFAARLRRARIPVVCKTQRDALWFDLRTLRPEDEPSFIDSLIEAVRTER
jgi:L-seryl-tRNA(Ser) seleniumtransferase